MEKIGPENNPKTRIGSQDVADLQSSDPGGSKKPIDSFPKNKIVLSKGVEMAKKRLRAFCIQKKTPLSPILPKPVSTGTATVFIGKLAGVKPVLKPDPDTNQEKKPPKPPKPGTKHLHESYIDTQKKTLGEIEDMKRKMELVDLGIPLGLICPTITNDKAMPTKAMPPIKSFIDSKENISPLEQYGPPRIPPAKVDELIREAKKAKAQGKEFKIDYHKLLPDYENPFQRKKEEAVEPTGDQDKQNADKDKGKTSDNTRKHSLHTDDENYAYRDDKHRQDKYSVDKYRDDRYRDVKYKDKKRDGKRTRHTDSRSKAREHKPFENDYRIKENSKTRKMDKTSTDKEVQNNIDEQEAEVDLKDFLVCDSWSENEEKSKDSSPKHGASKEPVEKQLISDVKNVEPLERLGAAIKKEIALDSPKTENIIDSPLPIKEKLKPVVDAFKFEIEDNFDDEVIDIFDENISNESFARVTKRNRKFYDSPLTSKLFSTDSREDTMDDIADESFLESVINEIKQEQMDDTSQDKSLVEYDESPIKDDDDLRESVTPELSERVKELYSSRSDYSDGYKSTDSGCKSMESDYKSTESLKMSEGFKSDSELEQLDTKYSDNVSAETWGFVLKICQPLLFRHDKNKCYKETRALPNLWYTQNPKVCNCVKDRSVVYEELDMCKMDLVDSLYKIQQKQEEAVSSAPGWYPREARCLLESSVQTSSSIETSSSMQVNSRQASSSGQASSTGQASSSVQASSEWEAEDSQCSHAAATPERAEMCLDQEYQRFMQAVWPEVAEGKSETPRTTPVRDNADRDKEIKAKKIKLSSEGWSQESDLEDEAQSNPVQDLISTLAFEASPKLLNIEPKKIKEEKQKRKRKHSTTSVTDSSDNDAKRRKKMRKKKDSKKAKSKEAKRRQLIKKNIRKLKNKHKNKKKVIDLDEESDTQELEKEKKKKEKKKEKKLKKKKLQKQKKRSQKKKRAKDTSSSSSSSSDSEQPEKTPKKKSEKKKKRKDSSSESNSEAFDVNILNNIKTERLTDDELKNMQFSPRRQKPREIINVKELQNDFVGNSIKVKQEAEENAAVVEDTKKGDVVEKNDDVSPESSSDDAADKEQNRLEDIKEPEDTRQSTPQIRTEESNLSQCSSQESIYSSKDQPPYEKDESHLRPSSQNSNYCFHDVMTSDKYKNMEQGSDQRDTMQRIDVKPQTLKRREVDPSSSGVMEDQEISRHMSERVSLQAHEIPLPDTEMSEISHHGSESQIAPRVPELREIPRHVEEISRQEDIARHVERHAMPRHAAEGYTMPRHATEGHVIPAHEIGNIELPRDDIESNDMHLDSQDDYAQGDYEMYEQMAMAYQSDVASKGTSWSRGASAAASRIETVVRARGRGEIKCDWRAGDTPAQRPPRPSRWGLKPGEVNIVLTGGERSPAPCAPATASCVPVALAPTLSAPAPPAPAPAPVYHIQSLANWTDNAPLSYDEAYIDTYGVSDLLQYGNCFAKEPPAAPAPPAPAWAPAPPTPARAPAPPTPTRGPAPGAANDPRRAHRDKQTRSLDDRIDLALKTTVLGEVAGAAPEAPDKDCPDKGILVTKCVWEGRGVKRVSFADGYKPGQDSDVEEPPLKKKKRVRRVGCAWPCPASHPDHVALWDALPPPPPPPGSPPQHMRSLDGMLFMPPEPPPGIITF